MLNMIRMELFRMFKTKSLYVIWTIFAVLMIVTTALTAGEMDAYSLEDRQQNPVFYGRCNERICEKYSRSSEKQRFDRMCQSRMFVPLYSIDDDVVLHCTGSGKQIVFP